MSTAAPLITEVEFTGPVVRVWVAWPVEDEHEAEAVDAARAHIGTDELATVTRHPEAGIYEVVFDRA